MQKMLHTAEEKFLVQLAKEYPTVAAASSEIINLQAILRLPKPTEHFMSDLHGESDAFTHILGNASGVIKEKVDRVLAGEMSDAERAEFATLIYYPAQKLAQLKPRQSDLGAWYRKTLYRLIDVCRMMSSKYTRSFVRKRLPGDFAYILDELLHAHFEDHDKEFYYGRILDSIIDIGRADDFITALAQLIQRLAVYRLHIVGDIFDRGPRPDIILDELMRHHSVDVQWGNHDVQWMGAAAGSTVCVASVIHVTLSYNNLETLEDGYGISLRPLSQYAEEVYRDTDVSGFWPKLVVIMCFSVLIYMNKPATGRYFQRHCFRVFLVQLLYLCFQFSFKSIKGNFIRAKRITKLVCKLCHFSTFSVLWLIFVKLYKIRYHFRPPFLAFLARHTHITAPMTAGG